jgi:putative ABC transport system permease protein
LTMALMGTAVGLALAILLFRGLHSVLYGVQSTDVVTLATVSALLLFVAFVASYVPAIRAARVDPVVALREEWLQIRPRWNQRQEHPHRMLPEQAPG